MKKIFLIIVLGLFVSLTANAQRKRMRHVVTFQFKATTSPEKIKEIELAFAALPSKIKEIADFEWGTNNSPEKLNQGLTHCFLVTFKSEADREKYLPHPAHKEFVKLLDGHIANVMVLDYWAKK
jgi:hypothetical protein